MLFNHQISPIWCLTTLHNCYLANKYRKINISSNLSAYTPFWIISLFSKGPPMKGPRKVLISKLIKKKIKNTWSTQVRGLQGSAQSSNTRTFLDKSQKIPISNEGCWPRPEFMYKKRLWLVFINDLIVRHDGLHNSKKW